MSISSAEASLQAVRRDLDLSAAGGMTERAVMNKINKQSGPINLAEFRGNLLGQQLLMSQASWGNESAWNKNRNYSSAHHYITPNSGSASVSGNKILCSRMATGTSGDAGAEARLVGRVSSGMDGSYRVTGTFRGEFDGRTGAIELHVLLIANASGYLSGAQDVLINRVHTGASSGGSHSSGQDYAFSALATLGTRNSYITLILRNISKYGSGPAGQNYVQRFWDFKVVKV